MELIERINRLEGEVKLIKAEIKSVLIDLREFMNNYENPFINVEQLSKTKERENKEGEPPIKEKLQPETELELEPEPEINRATTKRERDKDREELKKIEKAKINHKGEKIDIFKLTQLMKWADNSLSNIGKDKLNELIDLYELTGRLPKETKEIIFKIEDLSSVNSNLVKDKIEMKDCILAIYQLDRIVTGETGAQAPILLSEDELSKWLKV